MCNIIKCIIVTFSWNLGIIQAQIFFSLFYAYRIYNFHFKSYSEFFDPFISFCLWTVFEILHPPPLIANLKGGLMLRMMRTLYVNILGAWMTTQNRALLWLSQSQECMISFSCIQLIVVSAESLSWFTWELLTAR